MSWTCIISKIRAVNPLNIKLYQQILYLTGYVMHQSCGSGSGQVGGKKREWIACLSQSLIGCFRQQGRHRGLKIRCQSIGQSSAAIIAKLCCFQIVWKTGFWKVKAWKASGITVHHYFVTILKRATFLGFPVHTCLSVLLFVCWFVPAWCGFILEFKNQKHDKTLKLRQ